MAFRRALRLRPSAAELYGGLGGLAIQRAHFGEAVVLFERALHLEPGMQMAQRGLDHAREQLKPLANKLALDSRKDFLAKKKEQLQALKVPPLLRPALIPAP